MALPMKPLPERPELVALLKQARATVDAMTPEELKLMYATQRKSWVIGEMMLEHPDMTRERAEAIYDQVSY